MLRKRVLTALWGIPLIIAAVWFDKPLPWFAIFMAIWGAIALFEFYRLVMTSKTAAPLTYFGLAWAFLLILSPVSGNDSFRPLLLTLAIMLPLTWQLLRAQKEQAFVNWAWTISGIIYVGWLISYLVALRYLEDGKHWVLFALFATFASDTAAFLVGKILGKHHLAPSISPAKTWEGAIGGIIGAIIVSSLLALPIPFFTLHLSWGQAILLGMIVSIAGQIGDLVESLFKRNMKAKDSGKLIPGHGGALDRLDSIVFASVVVYYYVVWVIR